MAAPARVVERLRLRADSDAAIRRAVPLLEDAFRTAALPDVGARIVVVRRLHLGHVPQQSSSQALSLLVEARFTTAGWRVSHAGDAHAERADAVWFRDALEAHELAAVRLAAGASVDAWFWPLAVPTLASSTSAADRLRAIAFSVAARQEAPAALPAWTAAVVRAGHTRRLVTALAPQDGTELLRAARLAPSSDWQSWWTAADDPIAREALAPHHGGLRPDSGAPGHSGVRRGDDRVAFVERMLVLAGESPRVATVPVPPAGAPGEIPTLRARMTSQGVRVRSVAEAADCPPACASDDDSAARIIRPAEPRDDGHRSPLRPANLSWAGRRSTNVPAPLQGETGEIAPAPDATGRIANPRSVTPHAVHDGGARAWAFPCGDPTIAGGLLFVVPVLERLGFGDSCRALPHGTAAPLPRDVLRVLLSRLRVDADDPAWTLATPPDRANAIDEDAFSSKRNAPRYEAPQPFISERRAPLDGAPPCRAPELWIAACRRWLRRQARIGLASLVLRRARIAQTATHVDVFLPLRAADVRVRRAGLDIDPGWVPWLARVVTFYYEDRPWT